MTDAGAIAAAVQSLKTAFDIGKALINLGVNVEISSRINEMNERITAAQQDLITSRDYQMTLLGQIDNLRKQIAELETWDAEAETYQLIDVRPPEHHMGSAFAYSPKEGSHMGEPPHRICATCYQERHKSILHGQTLFPGLCQVLMCHRCGNILYLEGEPHPEHFGMKPKKPSR